MAELNAQIPLAASFTPIDPVAASTKAYQMQTAGAQAAQQGMQAESMMRDKSDQDEIQGYLKSGGDLHSEEGIKKAVASLKGRVTPQTYVKLNEYGATFKEKQMAAAAKLAALQEEQFDRFSSATDTVGKTLEPSLQAYDQAWRKDLAAKKPDVDPDENPNDPDVLAAKERAKQVYQAGILANAQAISKAYDDKPPDYIKPLLDRMVNTDPDSGRLMYNATEQAKKMRAEALKLREAEAKIKKAEADARKADAQASNTDAARLAAAQDVIDNPSEHTSGEVQAAQDLIKRLTAVRGPAGAINSLRLQHGDQTPYAQMTPAQQTAVDVYAKDFLITKKPPPSRSGLGPAVMERIDGLAREAGMSTEQLLMASAGVKVALQARTSLERRLQGMSRAETQLEKEIPVLVDAMEKIPTTGIPLVNRGIIYALRQMGDGRVTQLDQAANVVLNEFEAIIVGNLGGTLTVDSAKKAREEYQNIKTPEQLKAWVEGARRIIKNAKEAGEETRKDLDATLNKSLGFVPKPKPAEPSGAPDKPRAGDRPVNNPGALRPVGATSGFMQFPTREEGVQALHNDLLAKDKVGIDTVSKLISMYAPPQDKNDTASYITDVAKALGVGPNDKISLKDQAVRDKVVAAIIKREGVDTPVRTASATPPTPAAPVTAAPKTVPSSDLKVGVEIPFKVGNGVKNFKIEKIVKLTDGTTAYAITVDGKTRYVER